MGWGLYAMEMIVNKLLRVVLGLVWLAAGLVFAASLLVAVLLLAGLWLARAAWARITGRPVTPWVVGRMNPRAAWKWGTQRAQGRAAESPLHKGPAGIADVTDVQVKGEGPSP